MISKNLDYETTLQILDEVTGSDHNILFFQCAHNVHGSAPTHRILINHRNWFSIKTTIHKIISHNLCFNHLSASELNCYIKEIQDAIFQENSFIPSAGNNSQIKKRRNAIWWTTQLQIKKKKTIALRRRYQKETDNYIRPLKKAIFKKNLAEYKKLILLTKRTKFKEFISSITNSNIFGRNFNMLSNKQKRSSIIRPILNLVGVPSESTSESVINILDFHFPWVTGLPTYSPGILPSDCHPFTPLSCSEVESVIVRIKPRKAVGIDGLPGEIFLANKKWFTDLLNHLLGNGIFPEAWKIARIILLDKDNKSLDHPSNFRQICVLPCWGKILDKVITNRLSYHLEENHLISENQFGFRKNKSTILALKSIMDFHRSQTNIGHLTCLISIDMANAFNAVDWNLLKEKIYLLSIPTYLKNIIANFLDNRSVVLHKHYNKDNIKVQAFADDLLIMIKAPASYCFTNLSQPPLKTLEDWTNTNLMTVNHDKCCFTILSHKKFTHIPSIKFAGKKINFTNHLKYLGLFIDPKLNWIPHLNKVQDKINNLQNKLHRITRATWGLNPNVKKEIYLKVIDRIISYGHEVWYQDKVKINMKVLQLQRIGLLNVTKCYSSVPTDALHVLAGIPPLDLKHDLRLFQLKHCNKELCSNGIVIQPTSLSLLKPILPPWNCASFPWTPFDENLQGLLIFTDGSKVDNKVAGAFVVYHNSIETDHSTFRFSDHATVYMAELFAIYKAIEFLSLHHFEEAHIITDSRSVLQALHNVNNIDPLVTRLKNIICCLKCKLHLHWIKAHVGFAGNERADFLAKSATNYPSIDILVDFTPSIVKRLLHRTILADWQNRWNLSMKGRSVYELYREVKVSRIQGNFFLNQLITGHGTIGAHQARLF
ncbi:RNA-directed DNA polymerase from mobile element jockey [Caerostris darwini]|uniref:RNA-directed DNA polymerase from mobile element jockey n=1 Tax=Caerostris darwini TaxID=1538125 RepID=A0AAV4U9C3_9ARAC|nr:RNA-directed DNA polymerase from mobile element jockey [Caerostris darwini]